MICVTVPAVRHTKHTLLSGDCLFPLIRSIVRPLGKLGMFSPTGTVFLFTGDEDLESARCSGGEVRCSAFILFLTACRVFGGDMEIRYAFLLRFYNEIKYIHLSNVNIQIKQNYIIIYFY